MKIAVLKTSDTSSRCLVLSLVAIILLTGAYLHGSSSSNREFNVRSFGALGNGIAKDTKAIQRAIDECALHGGGAVILSGGTFLSGSLILKSGVSLEVRKDACLQGSADLNDYPVIIARWEGVLRPSRRALISADHADSITICGGGTISADGSTGKWRPPAPRGPMLIEPISCSNVLIHDLTLRQYYMWTVHPTYCTGVTIRNVAFETRLGNSDGIDPDSCRRVVIDSCRFHTGDDNISIKSGKGIEGAQQGIPCEDITISNCLFEWGISSIALGSELSGGIRNVHILNCRCIGGSAALYLKTRAGRGGYVEDVVAENLDVGPEPLLLLETTYKYTPDTHGILGLDGITCFRNITVKNVQFNGRKAVTVRGDSEKPVDGLHLENIRGTCQDPWILSNAKNVNLWDIRLTGFKGSSLLLDNVKGTGFNDFSVSPPPTPR
jgi:hypothetical protein